MAKKLACLLLVVMSVGVVSVVTATTAGAEPAFCANPDNVFTAGAPAFGEKFSSDTYDPAKARALKAALPTITKSLREVAAGAPANVRKATAKALKFYKLAPSIKSEAAGEKLAAQYVTPLTTIATYLATTCAEMLARQIQDAVGGSGSSSGYSSGSSGDMSEGD